MKHCLSRKALSGLILFSCFLCFLAQAGIKPVSPNRNLIITNTTKPYAFITQAAPVITPQNAPSAVAINYGNSSTVSSFTLSGDNLLAGILVTAPAGFEVSTNRNTYFPSVTVGSAGTLFSATVYIRLKASDSPGIYSGDIVLTSASATAVNVSMPASPVTSAPTLTITAPTGTINANAGTASVSPDIQQFTLSGANMLSSLTLITPTYFELSFTATGGYTRALTIPQTGGIINATTVYVRSAANAPPGLIVDKVQLTSTLISQTVLVYSGINQTVVDGENTAAQNHTTGCSISWTNNQPGIGLPASGTNDIASFTAVNTGTAPVKATITPTATCLTNLPDYTITVLPTAPTIRGSGMLMADVSTNGTAGNSQMFRISGYNLTEGILVTPPAGFEVSADNTTFSPAITIGGAGSFTSAPVYIRLAAATPAGNYGGNIALSSAGAATVNINMPVSVVNPLPATVYLDAYSLVALNTNQGTASASTYVYVQGRNLYGPITVTAPENFEVSLDNATFANAVNITSGPTNNGTMVYIRLKANAPAGTYNGNIAVSALNALTIGAHMLNSTVRSTVSLISLSPASGTISATLGTASASPQVQHFVVSGINLTQGVSITAPANFEISLNPNSGFTNSLTLNQSGGAIIGGLVYARSTASAPAGPITGIVTATSTGAANQTILLNGFIITNQLVENGGITAAVNLSSGCSYTWTTDHPEIGLAVKGPGNVPSFTAVNTGTTPIVATVTARPTQYLYAGNGSSGTTVSAISTADGTSPATITVGNSPILAYSSRDGSRMYVSNQPQSISVINTADNTVIQNIDLPSAPQAMALSPDGGTLYVALSYYYIAVINTKTGTVKAFMDRPAATFVNGQLALSPDGRTLYLLTRGGIVYRYNTFTNTLIDQFTVPVRSTYNFTVSPDGSQLYFLDDDNRQLIVVSAATKTVTATLNVADTPIDISMSPDGTRIYLSSYYTLTVINRATLSVITSIDLSSMGGPTGVSFNNDGSLAYVSLGNINKIAVVNTVTNAVTSIISTPTPVQVRGNFITSTTCPTVTFTITVKPAIITPAITANSNPAAVTTAYGTASASSNFNIQGTALTAGILVTPPAGFEVSADNITFSPTVTIGTAATTTALPVYIRLNARQATGTYNGTILLSSPGAINVNVTMPASAITPAPLTITANNAAKTYGTQLTDGAATSAFSVSGLKNGETINTVTINYTTGGNSKDAVGAYNQAIIPSNPVGANGFNAANYNITYANGSLTVNALPLTITANAFTKNYGDADPALTYIITTGNLVGSDALTGALARDAGENAGTYAIKQGTLTAGGNYVITFAGANLTISPKAVTVLANALTKNYGDADPAFTYTITTGSLTGSDVFTGSLARDAGENVGTYVIKQGTLALNSNYIITYNGATLTIGKAVVTVTADNKTRTYGAANPPATFTYSGFVNGDTPASLTTAPSAGNTTTVSSPIGNYPITVSGGTSANYTFNYVNGTLNITPAPLTIKVNNLDKTYGTSLTSSSITTGFTTTGLVNGESINNVNITYTSGGNGTAPAGVYPAVVLPAGATGSATFSITNYAITYVPGNLTVNKADLTITANGLTKNYGTILSDGAGQTAFTTNGLQNGETITSISLTFGRGAASGDVVGSYSSSIVPSAAIGANGFSATNYNINYEANDIEILPATLTITAADQSIFYHNAIPSLTFTYYGFVNGEGPEQLISKPVAVTTATSSSAPGVYPITIGGAVSPNYNIAYVQGTLTISVLGTEALSIPNTFTPNGDGINDTWNIQFIDRYPTCTVNVFNRNGIKVFSSIGYGTAWDGRYKGSDVPTGTYYYIIDTKDNQRPQSGWIAVIR